MKVLVINAGSSSLKYQLFDMENESVLAKGLAERIGIEGSKLTHQPAGRDKVEFVRDMPTHTEAIEMVLDALVDKDCGVISSMKEIGAVGHRVLHGGEKYSAPTLVNDDVIEVIKECFPLGPLHNPANLMGIEACMKVMPGVPMVAVFDTGFHQTMPPKAYLYGVDYKYYEKLKLRRYGFHGTSHRFVSLRMAEILGKDPSELKIVTCHLGNGSSIAAVDGGKVVDTSMGLTPLEGLLMGTRSGDIDPAALQMIMHEENCDIDEMLTMLNKKSGLLGVSGVSSDMRDVEKAAAEGNQRGNVALERAVRFDRDEAALCAEALALRVDDLDVLRIELRHDHRDVRRAAVGGVVGDDRAFELGIAFFKRLDFILLHVDRAEDEVDH